MQYQISVPIYVRYIAVNKNVGLTDLKLIPTNPSGVDGSQISMPYLGDGIYQASFTPNVNGWWQVRVHSVLSPTEVYSARYYVGTSADPNPVQDDTFTGRVGEVQATPTQYTVLGRLKDIWDRLATNLNVVIQNATIAVTQSGNFTVRNQDGVGNNLTSTNEGSGRQSLDVNLKAGTKQQIQTNNLAGTSIDVGFKTGSEQSVPVVIVDFDSPTARAKVDIEGTNAGIVISHRHSIVHLGLSFFGANWVTGLSNGGTRDYLFITPASKEVHVKFYAISSTSGGGTLSIYEAPTTSANGNSITIRNKDRSSLNTADSTFFYTPTVTAVGTLLLTWFINSSLGMNQLFSQEEDDLIFNTNTKYLIRFNSMNGSNTLGLLVNFYEV